MVKGGRKRAEWTTECSSCGESLGGNTLSGMSAVRTDGGEMRKSGRSFWEGSLEVLKINVPFLQLEHVVFQGPLTPPSQGIKSGAF